MKQQRPKRTRLRASAQPKGPSLSVESVEAIQARIGYHFQDGDLLTAAFTHPSALPGQDVGKRSNQRLEFLGDRVLGLVIAERLFRRRPTEREGALAPRLNRYVKKSACADAFRRLSLGDYLLLGVSEKKGGGHEKEGILGDACEALIGALYLDGGLKPAKNFIEKAWADQFSSGVTRLKDSKTLLQEWVQSRNLPLPTYTEVSRSGPDHALEFVMSVAVKSHGEVEASGSTKQGAERAAAQKMLDHLKDVE
ncbi:MAG: ribonuclease III [Pseudomonadota bacterium]